MVVKSSDEGHRKFGRPIQRYKDCIKDSLKHCGIPARELEPCAEDRSYWRVLTRRASTKAALASTFCERWRERITSARHRRKAPVSSLAIAIFQCPRVCASRIELVRHSRSHERRRHN
ncbi:hypothetical protein Pcinc_007094 [Petrolisthes cinctipes]|uniref:C2H2-type domain-containing protein n=1 Tax=Petrolisthes cinctipes TaxID=88211 RepID=A0AAE1L0W3_PETCI|nr:hypothetical protein Pcinc_007094 [Petrolisthes cinctipes]